MWLPVRAGHRRLWSVGRPHLPQRSAEPRPHLLQVPGHRQRAAPRHLFLTRLHARFLRPGLGELTGQPPPVPAPLRAADRAYRNAIDSLALQAGLAA